MIEAPSLRLPSPKTGRAGKCLLPVARGGRGRTHWTLHLTLTGEGCRSVGDLGIDICTSRSEAQDDDRGTGSHHGSCQEAMASGETPGHQPITGKPLLRAIGLCLSRVEPSRPGSTESVRPFQSKTLDIMPGTRTVFAALPGFRSAHLCRVQLF